MHAAIRTLRSRAGLAALAGAVALGGCGSSAPALDTAALERSIAQTILLQHKLRTAVTCPRHVARTAGTSFTCTASLDVGAYPVHVTVANGSGRVVYRNAAPLVALDTAKISAAIGASILRRTHTRASVSCPAEVLQQNGVAFTCTARTGARTRTFSVVQREGGRVRYTET